MLKDRDRPKFPPYAFRSILGGLLVDVAPLRQSPPFARLWTGNLIAGIGTQLTVVAVGLHVWSLTTSTLAVSLVGALGLVPLMAAGLYGGVVVDAFDRRTVLLGASTVMWCTTLALVATALSGSTSLPLLYTLAVANSVAAAVVAIARTAVIAQLVQPEHLPAAAALFGISSGVFITVGPALAGVLVATVGLPWTYTLDAGLFLASLVAAWTLPSLRPEGERVRLGLRSLVDGLTFLKRSRVISASFLADIAAMTFGRPHALFPAAAATVIGGGASTVGILTASLAVGAVGLGLFSGPLSRIEQQGRVVGWSIAAYGASIAGFGIVLVGTGMRGATALVDPLALTLSCTFLAAAGASDETSAIFRTAILLTAAPDSLRGRLQGVFTVVVNGGPRAGDLWVGLLTTATAIWVPPVLGGALVIVTIGLVLKCFRELRLYRSTAGASGTSGHPTAAL
ncbi:MFS transporter [Curtobacterium sp. MWU13-2055]|uniref:MFS transporter n=1 Tax=Curtobacterium sp. MWU13-2055 TaxID=2931928 RepID=UPI0020103BEF|nr:MFS transporter [Curtobacterium sp. MWU13-2055]